MAKKHWYLDPEELTPQERLDRVVELLAKAAYLLAVEEIKKEEAGFKGDEKTDANISAPSPTLLPYKIGPVPYGQRQFGLDRAVDEIEMKWIKRIEELAKSGLSMEKIAKRLNEEDNESKRAGKWRRAAVWRILQRLKEKGVTY